jgi:RND superfamily putative drug exporter
VLLAGPQAGKVADVEENGPTSQLPRGYGSTLVEEELPSFGQSEIQPAAVVYERTGGLTAEDRAAIEADRAAFGAQGAEGKPVTLEYAEDGAAALLVVQIDASTDEGFDLVDVFRDALEVGHPDGLRAEVTGPLATFHDQVAVFDGLDTRLLIASGCVVVALLLLTYRSPVLWLLPVLSIGVAMVLSQAVIYLLARHAELPVNGQSGGIMPIIVFGVGTDYALLVISRYREELRLTEDRLGALGTAVRRSLAPVVASASTVVLGLCCLLLADMNATRSVGAVCAVGVACAAVSMLVTLPVLLGLTGRWVFWPFRPLPGGGGATQGRGWGRVADLVRARPRLVWAGAALVLAGLALGSTTIAHGATYEQQFRDPPGSVRGQVMVDRHFSSGATSPATVLTDLSSADAVAAAISETDGVASVGDQVTAGDRALLPVILADEPDSGAAADTVDRLRDRLEGQPDAHALVGGPTAQLVDVDDASSADLRIVVPSVLVVVFLVLLVLLRAVLASALLLATVVLTYAAALGLGSLALRATGFEALDVSLPLLGFVFLVALGVDYTIFLMSRVREEVDRHGHVDGVRRGLVTTGGVITSAGLVLAATFGVLTTTPVSFMIGLGAVVALGILLDTFVVRSVLVPALLWDLGPRSWWPRRVE